APKGEGRPQKGGFNIPGVSPEDMKKLGEARKAAAETPEVKKAQEAATAAREKAAKAEEKDKEAARAEAMKAGQAAREALNAAILKSKARVARVAKARARAKVRAKSLPTLRPPSNLRITRLQTDPGSPGSFFVPVAPAMNFRRLSVY
ncbi:MAG: hypothetical protein RIR91_1516, partial [Verrucomicrobiota bacterium]